jgi:peptide chain release factor 1
MAVNTSLAPKLNKILDRYKVLNDKMMDPSSMQAQEYAKIAKEHSDMKPLVELANQFNGLVNNIEQSKSLLNDPEMKEFAQEELQNSEEELEKLNHEIKIALLPKDEADEKNAILEVRAGTGGDEAALFAANLFRMYQRYADRRGWKFEVLSISETGLDGYKEASAIISGKNVFARLKFESGVHRVQRVPETEASGRIHTSAATVAVLPEAEEVDIEINESDLRIDVFRASGAGGQHVNTTESAVRITYLQELW